MINVHIQYLIHAVFYLYLLDSCCHYLSLLTPHLSMPHGVSPIKTQRCVPNPDTMRSTPRQVICFTIVTDFFSRYPNISSMVHAVHPPLTCCTRVIFVTSPQYPHSVYEPHHIPPQSPPSQEPNQLPSTVQLAVSAVALDFFPTWAPSNSSSHWLVMQILLLVAPLGNNTASPSSWSHQECRTIRAFS